MSVPRSPAEGVALVCMPWHTLGSPSIQIGCLQAALNAERIPARSHSFHLEFQHHLESSGPRTGFGLADYEQVSVGWENLGVGEWIFAVPPFRPLRPEPERRYRALLAGAGIDAARLARLQRVRERVPDFLRHCADEVLSARPRVVGFTVVYSQLWPSVALATLLKERDPTLCIVFGGASCEGPMGPAVLATFPVVDVVVRGEAEGVLGDLMRALLAGEPPPARQGLCWRDRGEVVAIPRAGPNVDVNTLAVPVYDEYFERLRASCLVNAILPQVPFESSRGCWWGEKHHCTFCGLNGLDMAYRSKAPERVLSELDRLSERHESLDFTAVDNIIDHRFFRSVLPRLAESDRDRSFYYETKANLSFEEVATMRAAGVRTIQPGIESLSTNTLQLMKKGVTALQNVRLLKWSARHGLHVIWNLLYGFPGERHEDYGRMAALVPSLAHFTPPELVRLMVYRFSPYHEEPERYGLRLSGPLPYFTLLYDASDAIRSDLAQAFEYRYADGSDPEAHVGALREAIARWRRDADRNRGALTFRRGPGFLVLTDTRTTVTSAPIRYTLGPREAHLYLACEAGLTRRKLDELDSPAGRLDPHELDQWLADLLQARLMAELDGKYLSLALPLFADRERAAQPA